MQQLRNSVCFFYFKPLKKAFLFLKSYSGTLVRVFNSASSIRHRMINSLVVRSFFTTENVLVSIILI